MQTRYRGSISGSPPWLLDGLADRRIFVAAAFSRAGNSGLGGRFEAAQSVGRHLPGLGHPRIVSPADQNGQNLAERLRRRSVNLRQRPRRDDCRGLIFAAQQLGQIRLRCRCCRTHLSQGETYGVRIVAIGLLERRISAGTAGGWQPGQSSPSAIAASLTVRVSLLASSLASSPAAARRADRFVPDVGDLRRKLLMLQRLDQSRHGSRSEAATASRASA